MKYIRTKDGRIMLVQEEREKEIVVLFDNELVCINKRKILKQADTIRELCDELVVHNPNNDNEFFPQWFVTSISWKDMLNERHAKHCVEFYDKPVEIYGAIWTNKGLIYVAKMNEKGELELL